MHAPAYEDVSNRMRRGALALPGLDGLTDRPAWITSLDGPGVRPTRPNPGTWRVQKGRLL